MVSSQCCNTGKFRQDIKYLGNSVEDEKLDNSDESKYTLKVHERA